jgi:hypothetical protein
MSLPRPTSQNNKYCESALPPASPDHTGRLNSDTHVRAAAGDEYATQPSTTLADCMGRRRSIIPLPSRKVVGGAANRLRSHWNRSSPHTLTHRCGTSSSILRFVSLVGIILFAVGATHHSSSSDRPCIALLLIASLSQNQSLQVSLVAGRV